MGDTVAMTQNMRAPNFGDNDPHGEQVLGELILYVSEKCAGDRMFGAIKLNKILWWSDFLAYAQSGRPITGVQYRRLGHGPAPRRLIPVREALVANQDAVVQRQHMLGGLVQDRVVPLREPNLDFFTASQIDLVNEVIRVMWGKSANEVSHLSHGKAWGIANDGDGIPYEAVFLSDCPVDAFDVTRTEELAGQFGW